MASKKSARVAEGDSTGHKWEGITELNKPLPKWWLYVLYATIVWAVGYWLLMPAWPLVSSYTKGWLGYSQRQTVAEEIHQTIEHGIRADDPKTRTSQMPAFGRMGLLDATQVNDVAEYVLSLSGRAG